MSRDPYNRDSYHRDSYSRDTDRDSQAHRLPSIYSVLGDVLRQPSSPSPEGRRSQPPQSSSQRDRASAASESYQRSGYPSRSTYPPSRSSHQHSQSAHLSEDPGHSYHLFNLIPDQGLVHQRSSSRDDLDPTVPKPRLPPSDPARKYACNECGNRFSKQSTLRNHLLTHTGERPFACTHPGCGRRFSMACNMQRHMRTHTSASAFEMDVDDDWSTSRGGSSRGGSVAREASMSRAMSPRQEWSSSSNRYTGRP